MYTKVSKILIGGFASLCLVIPGPAFGPQRNPLKLTSLLP
jgi:hypothetical protein